MSDKEPVAIITGAGGGIGRALALGLASSGYLTVLVGRSRAPLEATAHAIVGQLQVPVEREPRILSLDLSQPELVRHAIERQVFALGRVDVLINNAGQWLPGTLDASMQDYQTLLDVHLLGPLALACAVIETMKQQGCGYIFNVASRAGKVGFSESGAYCASKFALVGWSESLHRELTPQGIKVTALCPGWVDTDMAQEAGCELDKNLIIKPDDLWQTVHWLLHLSSGACVKEVVIESPTSIV